MSDRAGDTTYTTSYDQQTQSITRKRRGGTWVLNIFKMLNIKNTQGGQTSNLSHHYPKGTHVCK